MTNKIFINFQSIFHILYVGTAAFLFLVSEPKAEGVKTVAPVHSLPRATEHKPLIKRIVIFGDSLSDTGKMLEASLRFIPSTKNYWAGRFSDGFNWVDYLAFSYHTTPNDHNFIVNESIGGATAHDYSKDDLWKEIFLNFFPPDPANIPKIMDKITIKLMSNLPKQIEEFKSAGNHLNPTDLVIIWIGANDLLWVGEKYYADKRHGQIIANNAIKIIIESILSLYAEYKLENFVIMGLPDFNLLPRFNKETPKFDEVTHFNNRLNYEVEKLAATRGFHIHFFNVNAYFNNFILKNSEKLGFRDIAHPSFKGWTVEPNPQIITDHIPFSIDKAGNDDHVFWDDVHPTSKTNTILAQFLKDELLDKYFNLRRSQSYHCNFVDVHNSGAYVLEVTTPKKSPCGSVDDSLSAGQTKLFSVESGVQLNFHAILGRSTHLTPAPLGAPDTQDHEDKTVKLKTSNIQYNEYSDINFQTLIPVVHHIRCSGSTIVNFECSQVQSL